MTSSQAAYEGLIPFARSKLSCPKAQRHPRRGKTPAKYLKTHVPYAFYPVNPWTFRLN